MILSRKEFDTLLSYFEEVVSRDDLLEREKVRKQIIEAFDENFTKGWDAAWEQIEEEEILF